MDHTDTAMLFSWLFSAVVGEQQRMESSGFINPMISNKRVEEPANTPRTINEIQFEPMRAKEPIPTQQGREGTEAMKPMTVEEDEALSKVKKTVKMKKKDQKKVDRKTKATVTSTAGRIESLAIGTLLSNKRSVMLRVLIWPRRDLFLYFRQ